MPREGGYATRPRDWWGLFGLALALLLVGDLFSTLWAVSRIGVAAEGNPVMRWLLHRGVVPVLAVHVLVAGIAIQWFDRLVTLLGSLEEPRRTRLARWCKRWLFGLIGAGALIVGINVFVTLAAAE